MNTTKLSGTTAIVTGASRGFGRAIASALRGAGADVIGVARHRDALLQLHEELGPSFTPVVADVCDPGLAARLIGEHQPRIVVLNAGATPRAARVQDQTWESFSENWNTDVRHVFEFACAALAAPLDSGSCVISLSSGAAMMGSPLSGGYAGAKATIKFISAYAGAESERLALGIDFVAILPKLTPATALGATFVAGYAHCSGTDPESYLAQLGATLTADQVGQAVTQLATDGHTAAPAYLLTADGFQALP